MACGGRTANAPRGPPSLQSVLGRVGDPGAQQRIRAVVHQLDETVHDIRTTVVDLRTTRAAGPEPRLRRRVLDLTTERLVEGGTRLRWWASLG
jgi:signal transduction histidine kinase